MSALPPPAPPPDDRFATAPDWIPTEELLFRFWRLVLAMVVVAVVLAVLPVPAFVPVIALMAVPMIVLVAAISDHNRRRSWFVWRYASKLWRFRHDAAHLADAADRAHDPVRSGLRRAWLLLGLFVAVFLIGLVLAGLAAGVSEAIYDSASAVSGSVAALLSRS